MGLLDFLRKDNNEDLKEEERRRKVQKILDEREKSNNERILEKMQEEERQKMIDQQVKQIQKQRNRELFSGGMSPQKNIFTGHKRILSGKSNTLKKINSQGGLFFK